MQTVENKLVRVPVKHQTIVGMLKSDIINGVFAPGSKLPTRDELEERFAVSRITIQLAMDRLRREGFVVTNGRNGTAVAQRPPHLHHYGMVFYGRPSKPGVEWGRFWEALDAEARLINAAGQRKINCYYEYCGHMDDPDYHRLVADIHGQRLAGLVLVQLYSHLMDSILSQTPSVPCVGITSGVFEQMPTIAMAPGFLARALDHLQQRGRKRIAFITGPREGIMDGYEALLAQRAMSTEPYWQLEFDIKFASPARQCAELLMRSPQSNRPDGLIITDDNFVEPATMGIAAAGIRVPEQLDIVAHCNFPWPTPSIVPSRRLGYDAHRVMAHAIALIDEQRQSLTPQRITQIPLQFEDELPIEDLVSASRHSRRHSLVQV